MDLEQQAFHQSPGNVLRNQWARWASILGGSALAAYGLKRRSVGGAAVALVGGYFVYQGATPLEDVEPTEITVARAVTVNGSQDEIYRFWRNFENLPQFMRHLRSVKVFGRTSRWVARGPMGRDVAWDAEITDDRAPERIAWRAMPGSDVEHDGAVEFRRAPGNRGTEVHVRIHWRPPAGQLGWAIAKLFGEDPELQVREDLRRLKMLLEAGEIATTVGQPSARRSLVIRSLEPLDREQFVA